MYQVMCDCEKPTIDKRFQYATLTTYHNGKTTKEKVLNPVQYCSKCGGVIDKVKRITTDERTNS